eukprot:CAMPEP_0115754100 /NCGR_PEP_ID=MMETSP0272-20121206/96687_1 /TAXON_ID=71861 /ORGANISM="Scrippsiella trochoidea, Strain CCMP3099" /LENGTH=43 /DNA_ID= /DNA_START= /DNA_END= /DNA_ORIENTATION=
MNLTTHSRSQVAFAMLATLTDQQTCCFEFWREAISPRVILSLE